MTRLLFASAPAIELKMLFLLVRWYSIDLTLPVKNDYYEKSTLTDKKYPMKTTTQNWPANSDGSVLARRPSEI